MPQKDMLTFANLIVTVIVILSVLLYNVITVMLPKISYTLVSRTINKREKEKYQFTSKYIDILNK